MVKEKKIRKVFEEIYQEQLAKHIGEEEQYRIFVG